MTISITWHQIALRLFLTIVAGALVGINRTERGRPAGMRTTLLVCLAAAVAMLQVNLMLGLTGRAPDSFVKIDVMRLPLGILSGMGFIGAGAIVRRESMVVGVTTAATLWFVTVLGLCFGAGHIGLGLVALAIGLFVLWGLEYVESYVKQDHLATLIVTMQEKGPSEEDIRARLRAAGVAITEVEITFDNEEHQRELTWYLRYHARLAEERSPAFLPELAREPGVRSVQWKPMGGASH